MTNIIVTGIPLDAKLPAMITAVKRGLQRKEKNFWISDMSPSLHGDYKELTVQFRSYEEAEQACHLLDNHTFLYGDQTYRFGAVMEHSQSRRPLRRQSPSPMYDHYDRRTSRPRYRSRSPMRDEASKLDLELELLRKQRMIIEEERRLLMERKKLDLIKEMGPEAVRDYEYGNGRKRDRGIERDRSRKQLRRSPFRTDRRDRPRPSRELPKFVLPCQKLIGEMRGYFSQCSSTKEVRMLVKLLRLTIRQRLAEALKDKEYTPSKGIHELYRILYPKVTDKDLVASALKNVRDRVSVTEKGSTYKHDDEDLNAEDNPAEPADELSSEIMLEKTANEIISEITEDESVNTEQKTDEIKKNAEDNVSSDVAPNATVTTDAQNELPDEKNTVKVSRAEELQLNDEKSNGKDSDEIVLSLEDDNDWNVEGESWASVQD